MKVAPASRKVDSSNSGKACNTTKALGGSREIKAQSCFNRKGGGKQLKKTRITMKISKQRPHKFTLAKNTKQIRCTSKQIYHDSNQN